MSRNGKNTLPSLSYKITYAGLLIRYRQKSNNCRYANKKKQNILV